MDLNTLTIPQLRKYANDHNISLTGCKRKADILNRLNSHLILSEESMKKLIVHSKPVPTRIVVTPNPDPQKETIFIPQVNT